MKLYRSKVKTFGIFCKFWAKFYRNSVWHENKKYALHFVIYESIVFELHMNLWGLSPILNVFFKKTEIDFMHWMQLNCYLRFRIVNRRTVFHISPLLNISPACIKFIPRFLYLKSSYLSFYNISKNFTQLFSPASVCNKFF